MLLVENFLETLVDANQTSVKIAGQLFAYNARNKNVEIFDKSLRGRKRFAFRWILLLFIACSVPVRIVALKQTNKNVQSYTTMDTNLCMIMFVKLLTMAERYRMWRTIQKTTSPF